MNATLQEFHTGARLEFLIESRSFSQEVMDVTNDFCLARANSTNDWECISRSYSETNDGFWSFPIQEMGTYSIVVNPLEVPPAPGPDPGPDPGPSPDPGPDPGPEPTPEDPEDSSDEGFFDFGKASTWAILGSIALLLIGGTILIIYFFCCRRNKQAQAAVAADE